MGKKMQVLVVFEFDNIDDTENAKADQIIQSISMDTGKAWCSAWGADRVWVEEVFGDSEKWVLAEEEV
jgi:hypothetical protein